MLLEDTREMTVATYQILGEKPAAAKPGWERQAGKERAKPLPILDPAGNTTGLGGDAIQSVAEITALKLTAL